MAAVDDIVAGLKLRIDELLSGEALANSRIWLAQFVDHLTGAQDALDEPEPEPPAPAAAAVTPAPVSDQDAADFAAFKAWRATQQQQAPHQAQD